MVTILGPTASGKTALAAAFAARFGGEILSADSRQVYRRMDIGTGKDLADYDVGGICVPYHLIDIVEPGTKYNVFEYQRDFAAAYAEVRGVRLKVVYPVKCFLVHFIFLTVEYYWFLCVSSTFFHRG